MERFLSPDKFIFESSTAILVLLALLSYEDYVLPQAVQMGVQVTDLLVRKSAQLVQTSFGLLFLNFHLAQLVLPLNYLPVLVLEPALDLADVRVGHLELPLRLGQFLLLLLQSLLQLHDLLRDLIPSPGQVILVLL